MSLAAIFFLPHLQQLSFAQLTDASVKYTTENKLVTYENSTYGVKIKYPSNWSVKGSSSNAQNDLITNVADFFPPELNDDVNVKISILNITNINRTLTEYLNESIEFYKNSVSFPNFQLISSTVHENLSGVPAYSIVGNYIDSASYSNNKSSDKNFIMEIATIIDNKQYIIQYFAKESKYYYYLPIIRTMVDSFVVPLQYADTYVGFKIEYPSDWEKSNQSNSITIFPSSKEISSYNTFPEKILITAISSNNRTIDQAFSEDIITFYKENFNINPLNIYSDVINTTLAGNPALKVLVSYDYLQWKIKEMIIVTIE